MFYWCHSRSHCVPMRLLNSRPSTCSSPKFSAALPINPCLNSHMPVWCCRGGDGQGHHSQVTRSANIPWIFAANDTTLTDQWPSQTVGWPAYFNSGNTYWASLFKADQCLVGEEAVTKTIKVRSQGCSEAGMNWFVREPDVNIFRNFASCC